MGQRDGEKERGPGRVQEGGMRPDRCKEGGVVSMVHGTKARPPYVKEEERRKGKEGVVYP
jgi:hypothetical protein